MTTSPSTGLSPEAKEFVPFTIIPSTALIPSPLAAIYPPPDPQSLIYPLMKFREIDFLFPSNQPFPLDTNQPLPFSAADSASQIMLLPAAACYRNGPLLYSPHDQSTAYIPLGYGDRPLMSYPVPQPTVPQVSSFPQQRAGSRPFSNRSANQQSKTTPANHHQQHLPRAPRGRPAQQPSTRRETLSSRQPETVLQRNADGTPFQLCSEDFPSLPVSHEPSQKPPTPTHPAPTPSWNKVVSAPRPKSISPHSASSRERTTDAKKTSKSPTPSKSKTTSKTDAPRPHSSTRDNKPAADEPVQTKQQPQQKRSKQRKTKSKEEAVIVKKEQTAPFALDDDSAFPVLGQDLPVPTIKKADNATSSAKEADSTPGLINKSNIKANHTYQIRLEDMFNALNTAVQAKQHNPQTKPTATSIMGANPLDSNPAPKRGKEREQPKPRKPTKLKRIINKELEENQKQRQQLMTKVAAIKQIDDNETPHDTDANPNVDDDAHDPPANLSEYTSASCSEESDNDTEDDDDEILEHEPASQLQTPYAQQIPPSNIKQQIHNAGFREYCAQLIDRQLDELCVQLLITLKRFQDRKKQQFQSNPERARRKRRFVHGIREVTKHLRLQRLKCVLIAPDCQSIQSEGGLNDAIDLIINLCKEQDIPYVFTLNRLKLGRCLNKIARISAIGIFDYAGADQVYKQIIEITNENQRAYKQILDNIVNHEDANTATPSYGLNSREFYKILHRTFQQQNQPRQHVVNTIPGESLSKVLPRVPAHYAHSRQTSDTSTIYIDPQLINSIKQQHARASSGTFDMGKSSTTKKNHQRTLSDGATTIDDGSIPIKHHAVKTHSRTPSGCSAISQIEQQDYFEQSKSILMNSNDEPHADNDENRLKSIHEDTEEHSANIKRKNVEKWINDN